MNEFEEMITMSDVDDNVTEHDYRNKKTYDDLQDDNIDTSE